MCLGDCRSDGTMMIDDSFRMVAGMGIVAMCTIENGVLLSLVILGTLSLVVIEARAVSISVMAI